MGQLDAHGGNEQHRPSARLVDHDQPNEAASPENIEDTGSVGTDDSLAPTPKKQQPSATKDSARRVMDLPKDLQRQRFKTLTGHEPTDAELEMALDLNLMWGRQFVAEATYEWQAPGVPEIAASLRDAGLQTRPVAYQGATLRLQRSTSHRDHSARCKCC